VKGTARFAVLAIAGPTGVALLTVALGGRLGDAWPALLALTAVWGLFLLQAFSGRDARAHVLYGRLRRLLLTGGGSRGGGERRTIEVPHRRPGAPRLAWSHDGWAHADGHLLGLDRLDERYEVVAFGTERRARGNPPVTLELLPAAPHDEGILLRGLAEYLRPFDVAWVGGSYEATTRQALDARAAGGPAIVCYEVENVVANYGRLKYAVRERAIREVDHFCATSQAAKAVLELDGVEAERVTVVPPVVDIPTYDGDERGELRSEGRARWDLSEEDVVALFMGRGVWEKGVHTLAAAVAALAQRSETDSVRWLIAGEGEYLPVFRQIVAHYGATDRVRLIGQVAGPDRHVAYAASDVLVAPSLPTPRWLEQFGRVIPEGFAFGLPVVGTASGAIPEVTGDAGVIVPPADHVALADAVAALVDGPRRADLSERARRRGAGEYSIDRFVERVTAAIERARERRRTSG